MRKKIIKLIILLAVAFHFFSPAEEPEKGKKELLKMLGLLQYPSLSDLKGAKLPMDLVDVQPLSPENIKDDFSNIKDLEWLKPIIRGKKVFMLGENHYYQTVQYLRTRIFFALNTWDYYPLLIQEAQFSHSAYLNYYVSLKDDRTARKFYQDVIHEMIGTREALNLYEKIRQWNKTHPSKILQVGFTDVEHDYITTLKRIIVPYFKLVDPSFQINFESFTFLRFEDLFKRLDPLMFQARQKKLTGRFPFITPQYISCVIENLKSTYKAYRYSFNYYRQKAIVRNLTGKRFFGEFFCQHKVMIHGGGYHTVNNFPYPDGGNFYREGNFLSFDFPPTRGKTFSIMVWGMAYSLGKEMANIKLKNCLHTGTGYQRNVNTLQKAYEKKLIKPGEFLIFSKTLDETDRLIYRLAHKYGHQPLLVKKIDWDKLQSLGRKISKDLYQTISWKKDSYFHYDATIYVPRSKITRVIQKKQ